MMTETEKHEHFKVGQDLLLDKPTTWTSFDVVNYIRHIVSPKGFKTKVGHAGTLDPLASGLLIVCTGKNTKTIEGFAVQEKTYTGIILIGQSTPSFDLETDIDQTFETAHITDADIHATALQFMGTTLQQAPIFSARRQDGERLYHKARRGEEVEIKSSEITITQFDIPTITRADNLIQVAFEITCSKGTYIRSIANDFGKKLNSGSYLHALRRTKIGNYNVNDALTLPQFKAEFSTKPSITKNIE
ncbi:MAG: tRNA pseudouridine(55) synthase TruB [Bacteroidia bacterium]